MYYLPRETRATSPDAVATTRRHLARGLSQTEVARIVGISSTTVHRIKRAKHGPSLKAQAASRRCGGCGGKILPGPCILCGARAVRAQELERILLAKGARDAIAR